MTVSMFPKKQPPQSQQPPSGMMLMMKALGIEFDPAMLSTMAQAVEEIRARLQRIEEKLDAVQIKQGGSDAVDRGREETVGSAQEKRD